MPNFDVLIIGSGPAGVSAAFPLLEAGLRVGMVDGAREEEGVITDRVHATFGSDYSALLPQDLKSPKQRLYRNRAVTIAYEKQLMLNSNDFYPSGAITRGGLSTMWGGYATEFQDADFRQFPFSIGDIRKSYDAVALRIGISGIRDDALGEFHGNSTPLQPPPKIHPVAEILLDRFRKRKLSHLAFGYARNALLTQAIGGRNACIGCMGCLWPCANKSIYSSSYDLIALRKHSRFQLIDDIYVERIRADGMGWVVESGKGEVRARQILLGAGTISTTRIVMETLKLFSLPIRLLNNPLAALPIFVPNFNKSQTSNVGYSLAQLGLRISLLDADYAAGAVYSLDGIPLDFIGSKFPFSLVAGAQITSYLTKSTLIATLYFDGKYSDNYLRLESGGTGGLHIKGGIADCFIPSLALAVRRFKCELLRLGVFVLPGTERGLTGLDNHYAGTCPMGGMGPLATDQFGMFNQLPGVYVIDAAAFPSLPAKHLTFTIMANADRIARSIVEKRYKN